MARRNSLALNAIYFVVGGLQIGMALWQVRLLPGVILVLLVVGGLLCVLAGTGQK